MALAREVLAIEAGAVAALAQRLDQTFLTAVSLLLACRGRVVVSGIGKSGHVARKIASTMATTGTPAFFVHPAEASHGDLGMIARDVVMIALSYSGESEELLPLVPLSKRQGAKVVAMTGNPDSTLAKEADVHLDVHVDEEACPLNLAPTASTTAALAMGDALAMALLDARGFGDDFARSHPGGSLGRRLLTHVGDVMRTGDDVPSAARRDARGSGDRDSRKRMGMTAVGRRRGPHHRPLHRRRPAPCLERGIDIRATSVTAVMTKGPRTIRPERSRSRRWRSWSAPRARSCPWSTPTAGWSAR